MTCHGFGGGKVTSDPATDVTIQQLATKIETIPEVLKAYHVKAGQGSIGNYDIIFEFKPCQHPKLIEDIKAKEVSQARASHHVSQVDLWIIQTDEAKT